ncbi:MAG: trypsin-like peptidase domain-containing protein [Oscillospiraceae bacterium]|nr:trypsin-like peptidase domain-containing protein [Oscillospiraceae bacterium]
MSYNYNPNNNPNNNPGGNNAPGAAGSPPYSGMRPDGYYRYSGAVQPYNNSLRAPAPEEYYPESTPSVNENKKNKPAGKRRWLGYIAALLAVGVVSGASGGAAVYSIMSKNAVMPVQSQAGVSVQVLPETNHSTQPVPAPEPTQTYQSPAAGIADIVEQVSDCVVEISVTASGMHPFFGEVPSQGGGSGVVISADGYIATNDHVTEDAAQITVRTKDGSEYEAVLVGTDPETDLAVIRIDATGLSPVRFGDSDAIKVGETAIAIGNPLALGGTVTTGIISALNREITIGDYAMTLIQTSAPVNPGNSGGGLFDANGGLIGIVNAKSSGPNRSGATIEGLGFAIPVNTVKKVTGDIIEHGYVTDRPEIGIHVLPILDNQTAFLYRVNELGVYIRAVTKENGLQIGDIIVKADGAEVKDGSEVRAALSGRSVGDTLNLVVKRAGAEISVDVVLTEKVPEHIIAQQKAAIAS